MKKLLIYNHLGTKVFEADVYLEGVDFCLELEKPTIIWLKSLYLVDKEPDIKERGIPEILADIQQAIVRVEEAKDESKTASNQSNGDKGSSPASESQDSSLISEEEPGILAIEGDTRHRESKGTENPLGSWPEQCSTRCCDFET